MTMAFRHTAAAALCAAALMLLPAARAADDGSTWSDIAAPAGTNALTEAQLAEFRRAVKNDSEGAVRSLLKSGASPNFRMENGDTAFTWAVRSEQYGIASVLLDSGRLDVNELNRFGETPLMLAVFKGNLELFDALLAAGADPRRGGNWTPMHYAATEGRVKFIERLVKAGATPNVQTSSGVTPLMMAARKPSRGAVTALLRAGAYRDWCTDTGRTPADFARRAGDEDLAKYLAVETCSVRGKKPAGSAK